MNRENKRKQYEKGYYKTHACNETFVCKVCGRTAVPQGAAASTEIIARIASRAYMLILSPETEPRTAGASWIP